MYMRNVRDCCSLTSMEIYGVASMPSKFVLSEKRRYEANDVGVVCETPAYSYPECLVLMKGGESL